MIQIEVIKGQNLGPTTLVTDMFVDEFMARARTYNQANIDDPSEPRITGVVTQRPEDVHHRKELAKFLLKALVSYIIKKKYKLKKDYENKNLELILESGISPEEKKYFEIPAFILKIVNDLGTTSYGALQPITCAIDASEKEILDSAKQVEEELASGGVAPLAKAIRVYLKGHQAQLRVIDGNHRLEAMKQVRDWFEALLGSSKYPNAPDLLFAPEGYKDEEIDADELDFWKETSDAFWDSSVKVEVHLGLSNLQQRQLFNHLNEHPKPVSININYEFDTDNPLKTFTRDIFNDKSKYPNLKIFETTKNTDFRDWIEDDGSIMLKDAITVSSICMLGVTSPKKATPRLVNEWRKTATDMWSAINDIPNFGSKSHRTKTVAAQPVFLKGLARLVRDLANSKGKDERTQKEDMEALETLYTSLKEGNLDCQHKNPLWSSLFLSSDIKREEKHKGIGDYVFVSPHINLDAGNFDVERGWVRYGSRHNDIYKRLGDLMRFALQLKPRDQSRARTAAMKIDNE